MPQYITTSREETVALGAKLGKFLATQQNTNTSNLICFTGGLGSGKTAFCEGLAHGLSCKEPVSSPTFSIVNYYQGVRNLAHFDVYRLANEMDLSAAGFYDYLDGGDIVAVEWSENFSELFALEKPINISIEKIDENTRKFNLSSIDENAF